MNNKFIEVGAYFINIDQIAYVTRGEGGIVVTFSGSADSQKPLSITIMDSDAQTVVSLLKRLA
jgi:hypothetical protein